MKKKLTRSANIALTTFLLALLLCNNASAQKVAIGKQTWDQKNLNVSKFRNGEAIPQVQDADDWIVMGLFREPAWCYYQTETGLDSSYGKLYNWYAIYDVRGLAPKGWHVATKEEWESLSKSLKGKNAAAKMKSATGWKTATGTNTSGFTALPGGNRKYNNGRFFDLGSGASWWTSTDLGSGKAASIWLKDDSEELNTETDDNKTAGLSVRCVEGEPAVPLKNKLKNLGDSIIGTPIRLGNLEIADNDFPGAWSITVAERACVKLGNGWRLPTLSELNMMYGNKREIGGFQNADYWYHEASPSASYGLVNFLNDEAGFVAENATGRIRPVRSVQ